MNWDRMAEFIKSQDSDFAKSMQGVSLQEIEQCEAGCNIKLPESYVKFLTTMGKQSDSFHPFGATMVHNFYELVAQLPAEDYPGERFFKIALESDDSQVACYDMALDLAHSNGEDAPLVQLENGVDIQIGGVKPVGFTFDEQLTRRLFNFFELNHRKERRVVILDQQSKVQTTVREVTTLMKKMGLHEVLPRLQRVACLSHGNLSALIALHETTHALEIEICTSKVQPLNLAVEQLLDQLPGAHVKAAHRTKML